MGAFRLGVAVFGFAFLVGSGSVGSAQEFVPRVEIVPAPVFGGGGAFLGAGGLDLPRSDLAPDFPGPVIPAPPPPPPAVEVPAYPLVAADPDRDRDWAARQALPQSASGANYSAAAASPPLAPVDSPAPSPVFSPAPATPDAQAVHIVTSSSGTSAAPGAPVAPQAMDSSAAVSQPPETPAAAPRYSVGDWSFGTWAAVIVVGGIALAANARR